MSSLLDPAASPPRAAVGKNTDRRSLRWFLGAVVTTFFTVLLIWTEIWVAVGAAIWSVASVFHFGAVGYVLVAILACPAALWASWKSLALAWQAEQDVDTV